MNVEYGGPNSFRPTAADLVGFTTGETDSKRASPRHISSTVTGMVLCEFLVIAAAAYIASLIYNRVVLERWPPAEQYVTAAIVIAALVLLVSLGFRQFATIQTQPRHRFLWNGLGAVALAFSLFLSVLFLLKIAEWYSRGSFFMQFLGVSLTMLSVRTLTYRWLQAGIASGMVEARRAVLIGNTRDFAAVAERLKNAGIQTVGSYPFPVGSLDSPVEADHAESAKRHVRAMIDTCRTLRPDDILVLAAADDLPRIPGLVDGLSELPVSLHMIPLGMVDVLASSRLAELGNVLTIQMLHPPLSTFDQLVKRAFDIVAAVLGLLLLSPLLLIVSLAVKLDSRGPVLFRQTRHGYNNEIIRVFKFRSMTMLEDDAKFTQAKANDPRVTHIGHIMRKTNIDELPQLLNVLSGEMSIVGPRPHPIALNMKFECQIVPLSRRHKVKPGITGWAQVNGYRGETDTLEKMQHRFEHDLYYIENWSFLFDLKIILMTVFSRTAYTNAY